MVENFLISKIYNSSAPPPDLPIEGEETFFPRPWWEGLGEGGELIRRFINAMDIDKFQKLIEETYLKKDAKRGLPKTFMWFTEEVGELSRALRENNKEELKKEFADVLAWLFSLASLSGIRIEETISKYTAGCPVCHGIPCICIEK